MSEVKVNKISPRTNCGTVTLGDSGDTFSIPAGVTLTNSGTATGFGPTGAVSWDTTPKTTTVTAASGVGYFVDTTSGAVTVDLPAGSAGSIVAISDYANTAATNNITIDPNGTDKINGINQNATISTNGVAVTLIYVDSTIGWKDVNDSTLDITGIPPFVAATGGTVTCCGDYKIHTFTGPGTFTVTNAGTPAGSNTVDYLVVAGGGGSGVGGGPDGAGGGGAGGFRVSNGYGIPAPTMSPLANPTGLPVSVQGYPITVGSGGAGASSQPVSAVNGNPSIFSTITSAGGGKGGNEFPNNCGSPGGSGGGNHQSTSGNGNTPPTSPPQGQPGGPGPNPSPSGSGGGGAGGAGTIAGSPSNSVDAGPGGIGSFVSPSFAVACAGTPGPAPGVRYFSGGGAGSNSPGRGPTGAAGTGGAGGGGNQTSQGTINTGGGAGAGANNIGSTGGSGIVIIRYKFQ